MLQLKVVCFILEKAMRGCSGAILPIKVEDGCLAGNFGDEDISACLCSEELCNSASLVGPTAIIVMVSAFVAWFYTL